MKKLNRFQKWENKLEQKESETVKISDKKQNVSRIEFKDKTPFEKIFDSRVLERKCIVTKDYAERKKKNPTFSVFGTGMLTGDDSLRMNATITMVQRENTWHPYYEIKVEEEDLRSHFKSRAETANARAGQTEIIDIERKIKELQDTQVIQETRKNNPDEPVPAVSNKRTWNPEQLKRDLEAKDFVQE